MKRRDFLATGMIAAGTVLVGGINGDAAKARQLDSMTKPGKASFKLKYAPHFGMFRHSAGEDLIDQLKFAADRGFTA